MIYFEKNRCHFKIERLSGFSMVSLHFDVVFELTHSNKRHVGMKKFQQWNSYFHSSLGLFSKIIDLKYCMKSGEVQKDKEKYFSKIILPHFCAKPKRARNFLVTSRISNESLEPRDIHIECSKQFK